MPGAAPVALEDPRSGAPVDLTWLHSVIKSYKAITPNVSGVWQNLLVGNFADLIKGASLWQTTELMASTATDVALGSTETQQT